MEPENCLPGFEYPRIYNDGKVIFRLHAPEAKEVLVDITGKKFPMQKDDNGDWSVTTPPIVEGFHYYAPVIDGVRVSDPSTYTYFGAGGELSGIDIPAPDMKFYEAQNVPHGDVREHFYYSPIRKKTRRCFVYTPPQYDKNPSERYPVLYLQHGWAEDETGWIRQGKIYCKSAVLVRQKLKNMVIYSLNISKNIVTKTSWRV